MQGAYLDFEQVPQVMDFIHTCMGFLSEPERVATDEAAEQAAQDAQKRVELARTLAKQTWPARRALAVYLVKAGCDEEWRLVIAAVSKSTAHLLERFRHGTACETLEATLAHAESDTAFRVQERYEIGEVRRHVHEVLWRTHRGEAMAPLVRAATAQYTETMERLDALRTLAVETPWLEGELLAKLAQFEDTFLFEGDPLSLEQLDEELAYYREQKETAI